jgi:molybdopterin converting factor small subunit
MIRVRLFAALRELAGAKELELEAATVGELLSRLSERLGPRFDEIMVTGSVVVDGERAGPAHLLAPGAEVAVLPPVSGGATRKCLGLQLRSRSSLDVLRQWSW